MWNYRYINMNFLHGSKKEMQHPYFLLLYRNTSLVVGLGRNPLNYTRMFNSVKMEWKIPINNVVSMQTSRVIMVTSSTTVMNN